MPIDGRPLLEGREPARPSGTPARHSGTLASCVANLVLAVLGAGQLVLPFAMSQLGLGVGISALLIFTVLSAHSCYTISVYMLHFPGVDSYAELVVRVLGSTGSKICSLVLTLYAWGGALSFMVILKGQLGSLTGLPETTCIIALAACFLWPLSSCEDLSALKATSPMGCVAAIFVTVVVLLSTSWTGEAPLGAKLCHGPWCHNDAAMPKSTLSWVPTSLIGVASALPLLSFALNSSWAFVPILSTLRDRRPARCALLITTSNLIILANYLLIATFGYAMFCSATQPNILDSLGTTADQGTGVGLLVQMARVALSLQLSLALPLRFFVARKAIGASIASLRGRALLSAALVGSATGLAILPLSLAAVLGIVSSVCASIIIYILPAVVDLRLRVDDPLLPRSLRLVASVFSLLTGCFVLAGGLTANLLGVSVGGR